MEEKVELEVVLNVLETRQLVPGRYRLLEGTTPIGWLWVNPTATGKDYHWAYKPKTTKYRQITARDFVETKDETLQDFFQFVTSTAGGLSKTDVWEWHEGHPERAINDMDQSEDSPAAKGSSGAL